MTRFIHWFEQKYGRVFLPMSNFDSALEEAWKAGYHSRKNKDFMEAFQPPVEKLEEKPPLGLRPRHIVNHLRRR